MIFFLLIFILMIFNKAEFAPEHQFHNDYLSKEKANAIKGIFVVLIVFSHATQYVKLGGIYDEAYMVLKDYLSQLVVVMFLFYSGYGITEALKKRRFQYVKSIMTKRFREFLLILL